MELDANDTGIRNPHATFLATVRNDRQAALAEVRRIEERDPSSTSVPHRIMTGWVYSFVREYGRAEQEARAALAVAPDYPQALYVLGLAAIAQSRPADAVPPLEKAVALAPGDSVSFAYLACAYALAGQRAKARSLLSELSERAGREYIAPMRFVLIHASLGDVGSAVKWLNQCYEERLPMLWWLNVIPLVDSLRLDPRFIALKRKIGLPD